MSLPRWVPAGDLVPGMVWVEADGATFTVRAVSREGGRVVVDFDPRPWMITPRLEARAATLVRVQP